MIEYVTGNMFDADVESLVNPVNCVGVMGRGLALQFKNLYPDNFKFYKTACNKANVVVGRMFIFETKLDKNPKYIINFPTKDQWRNNSLYSYISSGLIDLKYVVQKLDINSIAIPPIGCGLGGLDWNIVRSNIEETFLDLNNVRVLIYG